MAEAVVKKLLNELQSITEDAISRLNTMDSDELELLANRREELVLSIEEYRNSINEENREQIAYILSFDMTILKRMLFLKNEAGEWMHKQGAIRTQQSAYQNAYSLDSMFIDHRK
ncbi:hypothetical protein [Saccharibacillus alkalitolerans]|uniref:Flagellar protein FliT n=1 Tax=Saccharibacillus alkalitolerans TaxID=2705290 RepID=A0ABX0F597_9BACL|nr:hypothetical protein [Saccharibacillus alkalitolerans]NGZ76116.1 hypothetical protein [Saccharibacillus alkalitolerans]